jgi:putative radical SAM enzyme (TIGR03279 family)
VARDLAYDGATRSDYASTKPQVEGAWIKSIEDGSPAWEAGLEPGMRVDRVNGRAPLDIIDWRWEASDDVATLDVYVPEGVCEESGEFVCVLEREPGQDWGIEFTDVLFDGIRTCVNACQFCFMRMLPEDARASLTLRDDDFRLSFLQGNFVTLTNVDDEDLRRIIDCRLEPMNVSIHAVSPDVRRSLIGRNADRGIEVLEALCDAGIEVHGQIVLCGGINDGEELRRTLDWVEARPNITSLALVPMGYTKYSRQFSESFSESVEASRAVVRLIEPYQRRARETLGITRFQLSDEFYVDAELPVPDAESYDGYPQFYDGIGMLRSFLDEADCMGAGEADRLVAVARALGAPGGGEGTPSGALLVCGEAALGVVEEFLHGWGGLCRARGIPFGVEALAIRNDYYGGDVNVTGLIVSCDLLAQLPADLTGRVVVLPEVMFNFDQMTLDGDTQSHIVGEISGRGGRAVVAIPSPGNIVCALEDAVRGNS